MQLTHGGSVMPVFLPACLPALLSAGGPAVFNESHEGRRRREEETEEEVEEGVEIWQKSTCQMLEPHRFVHSMLTRHNAAA